MKRKNWAFACGIFWAIGGFLLLRKGLFFLSVSTENIQEPGPLVSWMFSFTHSLVQSHMLLMIIALFLGMLKGRKVMAKAALRVIQRWSMIHGEKISFSKVLDQKMWILIGCMVLLGIGLNYIGFPHDIRGVIDIAVGSALLQGALVYFKASSQLKKSVAP